MGSPFRYRSAAMHCRRVPRLATCYGSTDGAAFGLGEQPAPEFDQRSVPLRLCALLGAPAAPLYANTLIIVVDESQKPGLEQGP
jgi:hypothetical protein